MVFVWSPSIDGKGATMVLAIIVGVVVLELTDDPGAARHHRDLALAVRGAVRVADLRLLRHVAALVERLVEVRRASRSRGRWPSALRPVVADRQVPAGVVLQAPARPAQVGRGRRDGHALDVALGQLGGPVEQLVPRLRRRVRVEAGGRRPGRCGSRARSTARRASGRRSARRRRVTNGATFSLMSANASAGRSSSSARELAVDDAGGDVAVVGRGHVGLLAGGLGRLQLLRPRVARHDLQADCTLSCEALNASTFFLNQACW